MLVDWLVDDVLILIEVELDVELVEVDLLVELLVEEVEVDLLVLVD